jgi:hypothetical protein
MQAGLVSREAVFLMPKVPGGTPSKPSKSPIKYVPVPKIGKKGSA